ncbi:uncharacterized protein LOC144356259 [Saccoglossus kowalevskii]
MKTAAMQILGILLAACILFKETMATGNFDPINTICSETPIKDHFHYWDFTGKVDPMTPQNSCDLGPNNAIYEEIEIAVGILGLGLKEGSLKKSGNNIVELVDTFPSSPHRMNNKYCALNLQNDYVDFGAFQTECFGNIALCTSGLTVAIWLKINLTENPDTGVRTTFSTPVPMTQPAEDLVFRSTTLLTRSLLLKLCPNSTLII